MSHLQIVFLVNSLEKEKMAKHKRFFFFLDTYVPKKAVLFNSDNNKKRLRKTKRNDVFEMLTFASYPLKANERNILSDSKKQHIEKLNI